MLSSINISHIFVFDQDKDSWFRWAGSEWSALTRAQAPVITHRHFSGTGTRTLQDNGREAIEQLFTASFGPARP